MSRLPWLWLLPLALGACERQMRDMYEQPRYERGSASPLWPDGKADRAPVPGTVPRASGDLAAMTSGRRGTDAPLAQAADTARSGLPLITPALLQRGRERYGIYCEPCHSPLGDGDGQVVRRGFPRPPSYHEPRLRDAPDRHFYDVITQGHGLMVSYADRLAPADRWAIVGYIRALQLSQHVRAQDLPPSLRASLQASPSAASGAAR